MACLTQWLTRSQTCPECRRTCTQSETKRIFLNILNSEDVDSFIKKLTLQGQRKDETIQSLKTRIDVTEKCNQEKEKEYQKTLGYFKELVKTTEAKHVHVQWENTKLKKKVEVLKTEKDKTTLQEEKIKSLKRKIDWYEDFYLHKKWAYQNRIKDLTELMKTSEASYKKEIQLSRNENDHIQSKNTELKKKVEVMEKVEDTLTLQGQKKDERIESLKAQMVSYREESKEKIKDLMEEIEQKKDEENKYKKTITLQGRWKDMTIKCLEGQIDLKEKNCQKKEKEYKAIMDLAVSLKTKEAFYEEEIEFLKTENYHIQSKNIELKQKIDVMKKFGHFLLETADDFSGHHIKLEENCSNLENENCRFELTEFNTGLNPMNQLKRVSSRFNLQFLQFLSENKTQ